MKKGERAVQDIETCLEEFDTKPFEASNPVLCTLQPAIVESDELIDDLTNEFFVKTLPVVTPFLKTKGLTSHMTASNEYRVVKKKRRIKWKKILLKKAI